MRDFYDDIRFGMQVGVSIGVGLLLVAVAGCATPGTRGSPANSPAADPAPARAAPAGFVEASFGELERDRTGGGHHELSIRARERGSVSSPIDEVTADFVERFRKDKTAAIAWAKTRSELRTALELAPRVKSARLEFHQGAFSLRLYDEDAPLESDHPHVAALVSEAPLFVAVEALEGFPY